MKIFLTTRERIAGLFLLGTVALVVAFFVGAAVHNRWLAARVRYFAQVERGDGLRTGSPVLLSGVEVGEIGELRITDDGKVTVELVLLAGHAHRVRPGSKAVVRRLLGIGEKRIHLTTPPSAASKPLADGAWLPVHEPVDILDAVADLDFGTYLKTANRAISAVEKLMQKLEENDRLDRLVAAFDRLGPLLDKLDKLLGDVGTPITALVKHPALPGALQGLDDLLHDSALRETLAAAHRLLADPALRRTVVAAEQLLADPAARKFVRGAAEVLDPQKINRLIDRSEALVGRLDALLGEKGPATSVLTNADRLLADGKVERLIGAMERLTDEKKLARILDNVATLAEQTGRIAPEIPHITKELTATLREAVVVLKAMQKTWYLEGKASDARKELDRAKEDKPKAAETE
ncbi:MAG: MCE family protein [Deltaproteobacteria bacterium]|nr:MCE family protein [Deltaproteobacteria bacterium]